MKNTYLSVKLSSLRRISVHLFTSLPKPNSILFKFIKNNEQPIDLKLIKQVASAGTYLFELELPYDYPFGEDCLLASSHLNITKAIDLSNVINFPEFDTLFNYEKDDLGITYSKEKTIFTLWAPLASAAMLKIENEDHTFSFIQMKREEKGIYRIEVNGDLLNRRYHYIVNNYGSVRESNDPFGYGADFSSEYSAVVDKNIIASKPRIVPQKEIKRNTDATIYELHVRDFTEHKSSDIVHKGKYLGLIEEDKKTPEGNPAGLDYLKMLGVSHIQLQPILDFAGNDSPDSNKEYNWGYDPISFFALEGSYSLHPEIPQYRLEEFREVVDSFHRNNLRVNIDVVYNHLFEAMGTSFEKCVPGYFYRRRPNGLLSQASGCGNDFASERYMARKAILLSVKHLFETFDIDGLRFDLMGLIDIETIKKVQKIALSYKKDALIYGEGWNMGNELPFEKRACTDNADKLPNIAFFNDSFRDIVKGSTFDLGVKGFASGDFSYAFGFEFAFMGSSTNHCFDQKFKDASQSLNYVECHDNHTLFDKYLISNQNEENEDIYGRILLSNALTILSFGIPFIHNGQEIGKSKCGLGNTYNVPKINTFDYKEVDERIDMVKYLSSLISLRDNELSFFKEICKGEDIIKMFEFENKDNLLWIKLSKDHPAKVKYQDIIFIINVNNYPINYVLDDYYQALLIKGGIGKRADINIKNGRIAPHSLDILVR